MERIAVIGIGRIGLCLALNLERAGYDVLGIDKNRDLVRRVGDRTFRSPEPGVDEALRSAHAFYAADRISVVREFTPGLIFVTVDTPVAEGGGYDHCQIERVMADLFAPGPAGERTDLVLACTTSPGYCDSRAGAAEVNGYALSYSPGFVAQGSILRDQQLPDQVLIGEADAQAGDRLELVYRRMCLNRPAVHRMSRLSAEIAKLATNCALTMKVAFANAIGDLALRVGAEPERILAAIGADARIGSGFLRYGFGFGGPCLPRDNRALNAFAARHGCELLQAVATDEMNRRHLAFQVGRYLETHSIDEPIDFDGITYKPGTDSLDESQPLALAVELARAGRKVVIREQPTVLVRLRERFGDLFEYRPRAADGRAGPSGGAVALEDTASDASRSASVAPSSAEPADPIRSHLAR